MSSSSSSSLPRPLLPLFLFLPLLLLLLLAPRPGAGQQEADCSGAFRSGKEDFVLDAEDAAREGAALLAAAEVQGADACERLCCEMSECNVAMLEPRGPGEPEADSRSCVLFDCVHRNDFVCRFVNQAGYQTSIREHVFRKHLAGPQEAGEPIADAGSDVIVQPGEMVDLNGVESQALGDAHIREYQWSLQSGDPGVRIEKTDLPDQVRLSNLQPGSYVFQLIVTDSNGQTDEDKVKVLVLSPEQSSSYCLAPVKVGPCRASFPRWYYDAVNGSCKQFVFGGCKPNDNNYLTKDECVSACKDVKAVAERGATLPTTEVCGTVCRPDQLICSSGCCLDRSLECDGVKHCSDGSDESHCNKLNQTFSRLLSIDINQRKARCAEPPETGPCRASHTRWYYDPLDRKCHRFTYGGCHGNENNFEAEDKCEEFCDGVTEHNVFSRGIFDRYEKEEDKDDSGSIALAVILSVAILALLAILTYCFLKNRRERSSRSVTTGPAHVSLSEQDTLVYNSTTKPV